ALDEPRRADLHRAAVGGPRDRLASHGAEAPLAQVRVVDGVEHRVHEEGSDGAGVWILRVEDHPLARPKRYNRLPHVGEGRAAAGTDAEDTGQFGVPHRLGHPGPPQLEGHRQDDVPPIALEDAAAVGESTWSRGELAHLVVGAVEDPYGDDAFGHLLAVRADVLDRRRARRSRDPGEALEAGEPLTDRVLHDLIP